MKTTDINRKRPAEIRIHTRRAVLPAIIAGAVIMLLLGACYAPNSQSEQGFSMDVTMESKGPPGPEFDTVVLAGLLINSGFEETLKDVTQLMVAIDSESDPDIKAEMEDMLEEILINVALGGTMKFSGNPYFAIEVDYDYDPDSVNQEVDFMVTGVPANKDYFLYMGGFNSINEVKQFFGLMEEDTEFKNNEDEINYSHLFYIDGLTGPPVTIPFEVEGVNFSGNFEFTNVDLYEGPGWYYVEPWGGELETKIKAPAGQPFSVKPGKTTKVQVYLTDDTLPE